VSKLRERYLWYLEGPWAERFHRDRWWETPSSERQDGFTAAYELARRHPYIGQLFRKFANQPWFGRNTRLSAKLQSQAWRSLEGESDAVSCLCYIGLTPWHQLSVSYKEFWINSADRIKGLKRSEAALCNPFDLLAIGSLAVQELRKRGKTDLSTLDLDRVAKGLPSHVVDAAIGQSAVEAFRAGQFLFSVPPDLGFEEARSILIKAYTKRQGDKKLPQKRCRWEGWLSAISALEHDTDKYGQADSRVLTTYRRIIDGVSL